MRHWLTILALACASVAVLVTTFSPLDAAEPSPDESITTDLHPGWNMVGWLGPEAPVSELFEAIPALKRIYAWNSEAQRYQWALPMRTPLHGLRQLVPGMGLWLFIDGQHPVAWTRPVAAESFVLPLRSGWNLVAWSGDQAGPVGHTLTRYGDSLVKAFRWDAAAQQYDRHRPWADAANTLRGLNRGDALWVELEEHTQWWVPGTDEPEFEFTDGITPAQRSKVRQWVADVMAFFAVRYSAYTANFTVSVSNTGRGCRAKPGLMEVGTVNTVCPSHEYFHVLQFALAEGPLNVPYWMVEGSATYAEAAYTGELDFRRSIAPAGASYVASIRNPDSAHPFRLNYHLGFLAAEWLVNHADEPSLLEFYRQLPSSGSWEEAFAAAFGLTIDEFYEAFESYRVEIAPPLPHLTDDAVRPVAAFLGDVPTDIRAGIESEMDRVHTFLIDRFGAEPSEYSVYVGSNWNLVTHHARRLSQNPWWDHRFRGLSLPLNWEWGCSAGYTGWIVHSVDCERLLDHNSYINSHLRVLLQENGIFDLPMWLDTGAGAYIALAYRTAGTSVPVAEFDGYVRLARRSTVPLPQIATIEGWGAGDSAQHGALSILAVDWLLERAGERALFEYYRLLPRIEGGAWYAPEGSVEAAFEQAFGLTIDEFYTAFEKYRATLTLP